jgi:hypothetical protein
MGLLKLSIGIILLAGAIASIPFATHQYDDLGAQCWLAAQGEYGTSITWGIVMRFATHYGIIWAVCIYCAWCYITIFKYVNEMREALRNSVRSVTNERSDVEKTVYRLQYYPGKGRQCIDSCGVAAIIVGLMMIVSSNLDVCMDGYHGMSYVFVDLS